MALLSNLSPSSRRILRVAAALLAPIVLALIVYAIVQAQIFHVTGTNPNTNAVSVSAPFFKISFNKQLVASSVHVTMTPNSVQSVSVDGRQIVLTLNKLASGQSYTVSIDHAVASDGKEVSGVIVRFVAKDILVADLPADQRQAVLKKQDRYTGPNKDPILSHLPYSTLDFSLSPLITTDQTGKSVLVLQAQLFVTEADANTNEAAATDHYKQEVQDYIKSLGLDPAKYTIRYSTDNGSPPGAGQNAE